MNNNKYKYRDLRQNKQQRQAYLAYLIATKKRRKAIEVENLALCEIETKDLLRCERELLASRNIVADEKKEPRGSLFLDVFIWLCLRIANDCYKYQQENYIKNTRTIKYK